MKRLLLAPLAVLALGGALALPNVAEASLPTGCSLRSGTGYASAYCSGGGGYYRAAGKQYCSGTYYYKYGAWKHPGGLESYVNASSGCYFVAAYLQKKS